MSKSSFYGRGRLTLSEIAKRAGVSIATVSNVLNNKGRMSQETSERIFRIVQELEVGGGADAQPQQGCIALVLADPSDMLNHVSFHLHLIQGMQAVLEKHGFFIKISSCSEADDFVRETRGARGAVLVGRPGEDEQTYEESGIPLVWALGAAGLQADAVQEDSREIARLAADYLLGLGHESIGCLVDRDMENQVLRSWHLARFLEKRGAALTIGAGESMLFSRKDPMAIDTEQVARLLDEILAAKPRPTALFIPGDRLCVAVYAALGDRGLRPPDGPAILSCDNDIPHLASMSPRPATISLNVDVVGRVAAETIVWRLEHPDEPPLRKLVRPSLVLPASE